jgi:hypothetical protein
MVSQRRSSRICSWRCCWLCCTLLVANGWASIAMPPTAVAARLTLRLGSAKPVVQVGAFNRWDADGNPRKPVDPKGAIDKPAVTAAAEQHGPGVWVFDNLAPGNYDLVILIERQIRIEGFHYPPLLEFDPVWLRGTAPPPDARAQVAREIAAARHYENTVTLLYFAGDAKQIRVLVQLLRDKPTSYDRQFGTPVATLRHEVWQLTNRYGGWVKERRTKVLDRTLMAQRELAYWTWIWTPQLGGIQVATRPVSVDYKVPRKFDSEQVRGLLPH